MRPDSLSELHRVFSARVVGNPQMKLTLVEGGGGGSGGKPFGGTAR
jgi:hypothetical protein